MAAMGSLPRLHAIILWVALITSARALVSMDTESMTEAEQKWGFDWGYSGISTFGHLPHRKCLTEVDERYDFAIIGAPFDTAVSYRPGARFGPRAIRSASNRHLPSRGFNTHAAINPYMSWARLLDCGDIPVTPFDNDLAVRQMSDALFELGNRTTARTESPPELANRSGFTGPKLLILGGDHSIALPALQALHKVHGQPVAVVHFDAHLDTLHPHSYPAQWTSQQTDFTHGSMFWKAGHEGLIVPGSSVHVGLRTRLTGDNWDDYDRDDTQGFLRLTTDDVEDLGHAAIVRSIIDRVGIDTPTYLSIDIDVLDPGIAPGTGAPEAGGLTMREMNRIIRGLGALNIVGADIVEVAPAYDDRSEGTSLAAAQLAYEILTAWVKKGVVASSKDPDGKKKGNAVEAPKSEL